MVELAPLPHWDMTPVFPSLDSPEFQSAFARLKEDIAELVPLFERHGVRRREAGGVDEAFVSAFEEVTGRLNAVYRDVTTLRGFVHAFVTTDAANDLAQSTASEVR